MKKIILILFLIIFCTNSEAQILQAGFGIKPAILISESEGTNSILFAPYCINLSIMSELFDKLLIEAQPGYLLGGDEYTGFEFGINIKYRFISNLLIIVGINNHSNSESSHNSGGSYSKNLLYNGIGIGYQKDLNLSFDIMYYWTSDKVYAYYRDTDWLTYSRIVDKKMNGILKIGFNISFTLL
jgi:hypothetical protein